MYSDNNAIFIFLFKSRFGTQLTTKVHLREDKDNYNTVVFYIQRRGETEAGIKRIMVENHIGGTTAIQEVKYQS